MQVKSVERANDEGQFVYVARVKKITIRQNDALHRVVYETALCRRCIGRMHRQTNGQRSPTVCLLFAIAQFAHWPNFMAVTCYRSKEIPTTGN